MKSTLKRCVAGVAGSLVMAVAGVISGCNSAEPPYPVEVLSFDEGLVGVWEAPANEKERTEAMRVEITAREVPINDGKLDAGSLDTEGKLKQDSASRPPQEKRKAYIVQMDAGADAKLRLLGVGFSVAGKQFLGLQVPPKRLEEAGLTGWAIPVHRVIQIKRDGDELRWFTARFEVGWIPGCDILDGTKAGSDSVKTLMNERAGSHVTTDIGRVLDIYREGAANAELWEESKGVLRRVRP